MSKARCGNCKTLVEAETVEDLGLKIEQHKKECKERKESIPVAITMTERMTIEKFEETIRVIGEMRDRNLIMCWFHKNSGYTPYGINGIANMLKEIMNLTDDQYSWTVDYLNGAHKPLCTVCIESIGYGNVNSYCGKCNKLLTEEHFKKEVKEDGKAESDRTIENGE